jgi:hypothetical protein
MNSLIPRAVLPNPAIPDRNNAHVENAVSTQLSVHTPNPNTAAISVHYCFARSIPMMVSFELDVLSFCDGFNNHHIGTLRYRQEGASTPSAKLRDGRHEIMRRQIGGLTGPIQALGLPKQLPDAKFPQWSVLKPC